MLDMKQLVLEKDKSVIGVFCDNAVTDHDGNLFDACSYASTAAINACKIPKYEMQDDAPVKIEGEFIEPPITTLPVSVTMAKIGDFILVDPTIEEWGIILCEMFPVPKTLPVIITAFPSSVVSSIFLRLTIF